ncbi:MAG TPA: adenylate/guanylate cyclase domain-containing protein, partial [Candidatus Latescibacteria bacterium]|nr:adenylate/guanylate cyclase domain-containing protein [Candidatus Latescibacterota bacterium]
MPERKAVTQLARKKRVARRDVLDGEMQEAIRRFIPSEAFGLLGKSCVTDVRPGDHVEKTMTILFSDIRDFTPLSERMSPAENFDFINAYFRRMESVFVRHNGIIDKYMGDAVMALFPTSPDDAVHCALEMLQRLSGFNNALKRKRGQAPIRVGIGLNT